MFRNRPPTAIQKFAVVSQKILRREKIRKLRNTLSQLRQEMANLKATHVTHPQSQASAGILKEDAALVLQKLKNSLAEKVWNSKTYQYDINREAVASLDYCDAECLQLSSSNKEALLDRLMNRDEINGFALKALQAMVSRELIPGVLNWEKMKYDYELQVQTDIHEFFRQDYGIYTRLLERTKKLTAEITQLETDIGNIEPKQISRFKVLHRELTLAAKSHDTATYLSYVIEKGVHPENYFIQTRIHAACSNTGWCDYDDGMTLPCRCETCLTSLKQILLQGITFDFLQIKKEYLEFYTHSKSCINKNNNKHIDPDYFKPLDALLTLDWDFSTAFSSSLSVRENIIAVFEGYLSPVSFFEKPPYAAITEKIVRDLKREKEFEPADVYDYFAKLTQSLEKSVIESGDGFSRRVCFCLRVLKRYEPRELQELPVASSRFQI